MKLYLLFTLLFVVWTSNGVDLSNVASKENFQCLIDQLNISFVVMRGYRSYGAIDPNVKATLQNAQDAGVYFTDVYLFPCRSKSPVDQANQLIDHLGQDTFYGYIWVDVETNTSPGCSWANNTFAQNCQFLEQITTQITKRGKSPGIYSSTYMWTQVMGSATACQKFTHLPLWYAHYDNVQSFKDFTVFGGWAKPAYKQYKGATSVCNTTVNLNWYPQCSGPNCPRYQNQ